MICDLCGEEYRLDVLEHWPDDRAFMLETCCEQVEQDARFALLEGHVDRREFVEWWRRKTGDRIRGLSVEPDGAVLDYGLTVEKSTWGEAGAFVSKHHRHCPKPPNARGHIFSLRILNGPEVVGVAMVHRPAARAYNGLQMADVARCCVLDCSHRQLVWNACSQLYGACARESKRRGLRKIITYTLDSELATSLRAAGWNRESQVRARSWAPRGRAVNPKTDTAKKWRWGKILCSSFTTDPTPSKP